MQRLILSIILGLIFPTAGLTALLFARDSMPRSALTEIRIEKKVVPGIMCAPFAIPLYMLVYMKEKEILPSALDTPWFGLSSIILFNGILYGIIFYPLLGRLERFKNQSITTSETPLAFEQED